MDTRIVINMSCQKCCFNPCARTEKCAEGVYYRKDRHGKVTYMVDVRARLSESTIQMISRAVEKALGI